MEIDRECKLFKAAFDVATHPIILKSNHKYDNMLGNRIPYICYDDVMDYKCAIRAYPKNGMPSFVSTEEDVVCQYDSIENMVSDGWVID